MPEITGPVGARSKPALDLAVSPPLAVVLPTVMAAISHWIRRDSTRPPLFRPGPSCCPGRRVTPVQSRILVDVSD